MCAMLQLNEADVREQTRAKLLREPTASPAPGAFIDMPTLAPLAKELRMKAMTSSYGADFFFRVIWRLILTFSIAVCASVCASALLCDLECFLSV
jgi:hypothetical protein